MLSKDIFIQNDRDLDFFYFFHKIILLKSIEKTLQAVTEMQKTQFKLLKIAKHRQSKKSLSLFFHKNDFVDNILEENFIFLSTADQDTFFGRTCGFQYADSLKIAMTAVTILFASYNDGYKTFRLLDSSSLRFSNTSVSSKNTVFQIDDRYSFSTNSPLSKNTKIILGKASKASICASKYIINPEQRAKKIASLIKEADIEFCKEFWRLPGSFNITVKMVKKVFKRVTPTLEVNLVKRISLVEKLILPKFYFKKESQKNEFVTVLPPIAKTSNDSVNIRILSYRKLMGMVILFPFSLNRIFTR